MANERRLAELGALAKIFAQFQEPQLQQAQLQQRGQGEQTAAMLSALGLVQQRTEAEQRAAEAAIRNDIAMRELGLRETAAPLAARGAEEQIVASQAERALGGRKIAASERAAATAEEQNRIEREKLAASERAGQGTRLVDILQLLTKPETGAEGQELIGAGLEGRPEFAGVTRALGARAEEKRKTKEAALAPGLRVMQGQTQSQGPQGPPLPPQNIPGEIFGRSVVDLIPNLANVTSGVTEAGLGALGMKTNFGRVPSWWEAYKRLVTPQPTK